MLNKFWVLITSRGLNMLQRGDPALAKRYLFLRSQSITPIFTSRSLSKHHESMFNAYSFHSIEEKARETPIWVCGGLPVHHKQISVEE
jgi:hypothetical protein